MKIKKYCKVCGTIGLITFMASELNPILSEKIGSHIQVHVPYQSSQSYIMATSGTTVAVYQPILSDRDRSV